MNLWNKLTMVHLTWCAFISVLALVSCRSPPRPLPPHSRTCGTPQRNVGFLRSRYQNHPRWGWSVKGLVKVHHDCKWGTLCDEGFGDKEAKVVCKSMGWRNGLNVKSRRHRLHLHPSKKRTTKIWLDHLVCNGNERSIEQCQHVGWGDNDCSHLDDVSVTCHNKI